MINSKLVEQIFPKPWEYPGYIVYQQLLDTRPWWSPSMVDTFLQSADLYEINPHNSNQCMRLFLLSRVKAAEKTKLFRKAVLDNKSAQIDPSAYIAIAKEIQHEENLKAKRRRLRSRKKV